MRSQPTLLEWDRPTNIPQDVVVNYTVIINSTTSALSSDALLSDQLQFSIQELEMQLVNSDDCEPFTFHVVASVPLTEDSMTAIIMDTIPLCKLLVRVCVCACAQVRSSLALVFSAWLMHRQPGSAR